MQHLAVRQFSMRHLSGSLILTLVLGVVMLALGLASTWTESSLEFNRSAIDSGQWWRLLTGQWIHYGAYHLAMNMAAFLLCGFILFRELSTLHYTLLLFTCLVGVGVGLYWLSPALQHYAGLSGALHGLLVAGIFRFFKETPWFSVLALIVLLLKIFQEQSAGYDNSHPLLPVPVAVDAHLYGAVVGLVWGLGWWAWRAASARL